MRGAEPQEYSLYFKVWRHSRRRWIGREAESKFLGQSTSIAALERALPERLQRFGQGRHSLGSSRRQYLGVIRENRRAIYVNFFPKNVGPAWRSTVVRKCVWDLRFFGVEYDVDRGKFTHIAFQGMA